MIEVGDTICWTGNEMVAGKVESIQTQYIGMTRYHCECGLILHGGNSRLVEKGRVEA